MKLASDGLKVKGKVRLWVFQHYAEKAYCTLTRTSSFIHLQRRFTPSGVRDLCQWRKELYLNLASSPVIYMNY
jgi:hypothetical protein